jgi:hypothetical protein
VPVIPSYAGGHDQEDCGSRTAQAKKKKKALVETTKMLINLLSHRQKMKLCHLLENGWNWRSTC